MQSPRPHGGRAREGEQPATARLIGLDLARGLAVFGMYAVHVGTGSGYLMELAQGRSSALFAFLAGFAGPVVGGRTFNTVGHPDGIIWVPFVIAGMAVARRLDLAGTAARMRLAGTGATLAVAGYGGSWLALRLVPGAADDAIQLLKGGSSVSSGPPSPPPGSRMYGDSPFGLLAASPHSETTLSIVANTGVAIMVVTACLAAVAAFPRLSRLAKPVTAVGSMSLTAYVLHQPVRFSPIHRP